MVDEWVLVTETELPISYKVAEATTIEKGSLLKLTDSGTAILSSAAGDPIAGVAAEEKIGGDGNTDLAVYKRGRFTAVASGAITVGWPIQSTVNSANAVVVAATEAISGAAILGYAEATAVAQERIQVFLDIGGGTAQAA